MKKLMAVVLTLAMLVSMFSVAGAAEETVIMNGGGPLAVSAIEGYDVVKINVECTKPEEPNAYWGIGGIGFDSWDPEAEFGITSNGDLEQSFEFSVDAILAAVEAAGGVEQLYFNAYNNYKVVSVVGIVVGDAPIGVQLKGAGNGELALSALNGYEKIVISVQAEDPSVLNPGWGLGGFFKSDWSGLVDGISEPISTGVETQKFTYYVADIVAAYEALGMSTIAFNIYNGYKIVEVRGFEAEKEEVVLEEGVTYKQVADNNVRFVQMISEESAKSSSGVTYTVSYNGKVKATVTSNECYSAVSAAGETITAPEGYVFVACVIINVPNVELVTCDISFTEIEQ